MFGDGIHKAYLQGISLHLGKHKEIVDECVGHLERSIITDLNKGFNDVEHVVNESDRSFKSFRALTKGDLKVIVKTFERIGVTMNYQYVPPSYDDEDDEACYCIRWEYTPITPPEKNQIK